jgi:hypothetical protein
MEKVIVDPALLAGLSSIKEAVQLCTPEGEVFGGFVPVGAANPYDHGRPFLSEEELRKRASRKEGRTWAEIKADLEKRG